MPEKSDDDGLAIRRHHGTEQRHERYSVPDASNGGSYLYKLDEDVKHPPNCSLISSDGTAKYLRLVLV